MDRVGASEVPSMIAWSLPVSGLLAAILNSDREFHIRDLRRSEIARLLPSVSCNSPKRSTLVNRAKEILFGREESTLKQTLLNSARFLL